MNRPPRILHDGVAEALHGEFDRVARLADLGRAVGRVDDLRGQAPLEPDQIHEVIKAGIGIIQQLHGPLHGVQRRRQCLHLLDQMHGGRKADGRAHAWTRPRSARQAKL